MVRLAVAAAALAVTTLVGAPALAHHSQAMFDTSKEVLIEGTIARLDWKNPHMYLFVRTVGEDGKPQIVQGERLTLTDDHLRLRYETTVEDPVYLEKPASFSMLWDHRPDLELSPPSEACDSAVARRYLDYRAD